MPVQRRLILQRLRVLRLRGLTAHSPSNARAASDSDSDSDSETGDGSADDASFAPFDLDVEAGTLVTVMPGARARMLLDCIEGRREATGGQIEIAGTALEQLDATQRRALRRRTLSRVTLDRDGGAPVPVRGAARSVLTVRDVMRPSGSGSGEPPIGPALPLGPLLDRPAAGLDPGGRALVAVARALLSNADVLLLDAHDIPAESGGAESLAGWLRDVVDLEGRTVLTATSHPSLLDAAEQVVGLRRSP